MQNKLKNKISFLITTAFLLPSVTLALEKYTLLAPLPGIDATTDFTSWLPQAFNLTIGIAAGLAFVMITLGGIMYATTDAITNKGEGKKYITNAIYGLLLVIGSWVILNTINPQILDFKWTVPLPNIQRPVPSATVATKMTSAQIQADATVRQNLPKRVTVYRGACTSGATVGCVNMNGILPQTIKGLENLQLLCDCDISITGGTEGAHTPGSAHYTGRAVDIDNTSELMKTISPNASPKACTPFIGPGRASYSWEPKGVACGKVASSGDHWHIEY